MPINSISDIIQRTKHFHSTNHPIIRSFEPGEDWEWCYVDDMFVQ